MSKILKIGDEAPDIVLGQTSLKDLRGKKVILYFYPKDFTPGCTAEACNLRDYYKILFDNGFVVFGISPDTSESHEKFKNIYNLPFELIADPEKKIIEAFGVWGEKKLYGKISKGVIRTTFVIDENGKIEKIFQKVDTKNHAQQILRAYNISFI